MHRSLLTQPHLDGNWGRLSYVAARIDGSIIANVAAQQPDCALRNLSREDPKELESRLAF
jgi:hypothetical protein